MKCPHVLAGKDGKLSFPKTITLLVLGAGVLPHPLATVLGIGIIAASFGYKAFEAFLNKSSFSATASDAHELKETISHEYKEIMLRRDPDAGHEETP